jgi:hypothetical protein
MQARKENNKLSCCRQHENYERTFSYNSDVVNSASLRLRSQTLHPRGTPKRHTNDVACTAAIRNHPRLLEAGDLHSVSTLSEKNRRKGFQEYQPRPDGVVARVSPSSD